MVNGHDRIRASDDGLMSPNVHRWAEEKYRLVSMYGELFANGMKNRWDKRVYLDLYSGAGIAHVEGTSTFLKGSPLLALGVSAPFDKYIFCEADHDNMAALRKRCENLAPSAGIEFIEGDCHDEVDTICGAIPKASLGNTVLSLCFVDPFDFGIKFDDIRRLSTYFMDFLILLAIGMDANRNYDHYVDGDSPKIDVALGNTEWRQRWRQYTRRQDFRAFLAAEFACSMEGLGYLHQEVHQMKLVRSDEKNLPLYYLALFSRHQMAYKFWDEVLKYSTDQPSFSWG